MRRLLALIVSVALTLSVSGPALASHNYQHAMECGEFPGLAWCDDSFTFFKEQYGRTTTLGPVEYSWRLDENGNQVLMVPLRFISEGLGATVKWNPKTRTAIVAPGNGNHFYYQVGSRLFTAEWLRFKDHGPLKGYTDTFMAPVAPYLNYQDRMMVPIRYAAELLGWDVIYNGEAGSITFRMGEAKQPDPSQIQEGLAEFMSRVAYDSNDRKLSFPTTNVQVTPSTYGYLVDTMGQINQLISKNALNPSGEAIRTHDTQDAFRLWMADDLLFSFDQRGLSISFGDVSGDAFIDGLKAIKTEMQTQRDFVAGLLSGMIADLVLAKVPKFQGLSTQAKAAITLAIAAFFVQGSSLVKISDSRIAVLSVCKAYGRQDHILRWDRSNTPDLDDETRETIKLKAAFMTLYADGSCLPEAPDGEYPFLPKG